MTKQLEPVPLAPARPFLKWAGGKRQLAPKLLERVPADFGRYHEPFLGGGALFFALAASRPPFPSTLTDSNERLVRTYLAVRDDVQGVIDRLKHMEAEHRLRDERYFLSVREERVDEGSDAFAASWMIFLNKACFNGIYRVNKKGKFNVPWGKNPNATICDEGNLLACSIALQLTDIKCQDFRLCTFDIDEGDFAYFDPPYAPLSKTSNFKAFTKEGFGQDDQQDLRDVALGLKQRGVHVLLSNSSAQESRDLYAGPDFETVDVQARRSVNSKVDGRGPVAEILAW